jgi:hypothetical protein
MPHKGYYSQCLVILLRAPVSLRDILTRLSAFPTQASQAKSSDWHGGDPCLVVPFPGGVDAIAIVDLVDRPWPDHMGDVKSDPDLLGAWAFGNFGLVFPFALKRACQQSWQWAEGKTVPLNHKAFLRVRAQYMPGTPKNPLDMPADYEPLSELKFVTRVAAALAGLPQAISYFDPAGERVWEPKRFAEYFSRTDAEGGLPVDVWCNVRLFNLDDRAKGWCLMDTIGLAQLDATDHEAIFPSARYKSGEVAGFLLNLAAYIATNGPVIANGNTVDGPGDLHWQATHVEESQVEPPRAVIRWLPRDGHPVPPAVIAAPKPRTGA